MVYITRSKFNLEQVYLTKSEKAHNRQIIDVQLPYLFFFS